MMRKENKNKKRFKDIDNLIDILSYHAAQQPGKKAYTFLKDGDIIDGELTFRELERKAKSIAVMLQKSFSCGERALLLYPSGIEYVAAFLGCLYAGIIAVPAFPPPRNTEQSRIKSIILDADISVILTLSTLLDTIKESISEIPELDKVIHYEVTDTVVEKITGTWDKPEIDGNTVAFLQYTSGSTSTPKGVIVSHYNLIYNLKDLDLGWKHTKESVMVTWLPLFHDMGLIYGILEPLYKGFHCYILSPSAFIKRPIRWLDAISKYKGTHSAAPNFAYDLCLSKCTPEQIEKLDLRSWSVTLNAAEPVRVSTIKNFINVFGKCGFSKKTMCPGYGLAEATLKVSALHKKKQISIVNLDTDELIENRILKVHKKSRHSTPVVGCGWTESGTGIMIVDPVTLTECGKNRVGEIWVSGPTLARGYWNQPEETKRTFHAYISDTGKGPFLRTGDLGFIKDNELFITGRLKDLIIIKGQNYYPQDIELIVENSHHALRENCCAVFTVEKEGKELLVIVQEVIRKQLKTIDPGEVMSVIKEQVFNQCELPVDAILLIKTGGIIKTSSGKIQRRACKKNYLENKFTIIGQWHRDDPENPSNNVKKRDDYYVPASLKQEHYTKTIIRDWLVQRIAGYIKISPSDIDIQKSFSMYNLDSVAKVSLTGELEDWLGMTLYPTILYDYSTIDALTGYLFTFRKNDKNIRQTYNHKTAPGDIVNKSEKKQERDPIAIIGIGGIFPGSRDLNDLWDHLRNKTNLIKEIPEDHFDYKPWYKENNKTDPVAMYCKWGSFIDDVDKFDAHFFDISAKEAKVMDPQLRLLLQVLYATMQNAGYTRDTLNQNKTGMYVGVSSHDYQQEMDRSGKYVQAYDGVGNTATMLANRPSFFFNLHGPSLSINTACSSSLVALHTASNAIKNNECEMAFVAGVNLLLGSWHYRYLCSIGALSRKGRCYTFDKAADGYVPGEGIGAVLLKPLHKAIESKDHIYAVIRGSATGHGGQVSSITTPSSKQQASVITTAWENANIDPETIGYIEAHGTGTKLGDPIEIEGLKMAFKPYTQKEGFCAIGSAKAHLGHLEGAAGILGILKVILAMKHKEIPGMPEFNELNPIIKLKGTPFYINSKVKKWEKINNVCRRAGISSFGFGGTYAHMVIEEFKNQENKQNQHIIYNKKNQDKPHIIILSAKNEDQLIEYTRQMIRYFEKNNDVSLSDAAYTLQLCREVMEIRLAIIGNTTKDIIMKMKEFVKTKKNADNVFFSSERERTLKNTLSEEDEKVLHTTALTSMNNGDLSKLAEIWISGRKIDWRMLPRQEDYCKISLPTYPFAKNRYWWDT